MTTVTGRTLTPQGEAIVRAIESGIAVMTPQRWREESAKAAEFEDEGEWFAPEFEAARKATEGIEWDFAGWQNTLEYITVGSGKIGGVSLIATPEETIDANAVPATESASNTTRLTGHAAIDYAEANGLDWFNLGHELRASADDAHEGNTPSLDIAYSFLLDNPECFGYQDWPAGMPQTAPEEVQKAYGYVAASGSDN